MSEPEASSRREMETLRYRNKINYDFSPAIFFSSEFSLMKGRVNDRKPASIPASLFTSVSVRLSVSMRCAYKEPSASNVFCVFICLQDVCRAAARRAGKINRNK